MNSQSITLLVRNLLTSVRSRVAPFKDPYSNSAIAYNIKDPASHTRMSELVKEAGLRSAVEKRMGSNPIPSKEFPDSPKIRW